MAERARIARFFAPLTLGEAGSFDLMDDAAVLTPPAGQALVVTTDSVIQGIHVLADAAPQQYAVKLVRRNLSDLAAMGATPWRYTLNLHTPRGLGNDWVEHFAAALAEEQERFRMVLVGGDSTSGDGAVHITMTCFGLLSGTPLRRNGAKAGDAIYVSGTLGDAAFALTQLQRHAPLEHALTARYHSPTPRLELGYLLQSIAHAVIDISDGLLADLGQICGASHVGATVLRDSIPLSATLAALVADNPERWRWPLAGGDDYELLFTVGAEDRARIEALASAAGVPLTQIGSITAELGISLLNAAGEMLPMPTTGWEHA